MSDTNYPIKNNHGEIAKRLDPIGKVKELIYLKSGNRCAFPDCEQVMYHSDTLIGQVCHIEDALPGERWNSENSNEDNRKEENLML